MPELLAVVVVLIVAVVAWIGAWMHARDPANYNAGEEVARLRQHVAWLQQRIHVARREKWGAEMVANLSDELKATACQLENIRAAKCGE